MYMIVWLVVLTILKNISQWEGLSHILREIKNVPNHHPVVYVYVCVYVHDDDDDDMPISSHQKDRQQNPLRQETVAVPGSHHSMAAHLGKQKAKALRWNQLDTFPGQSHGAMVIDIH